MGILNQNFKIYKLIAILTIFISFASPAQDTTSNAKTLQAIDLLNKSKGPQPEILDPSCNCELAPQCGNVLQEWVHEDEKGFFSSRRSDCEKSAPDLKTFLNDKVLSQHLSQQSKLLDPKSYTCPASGLNNKSLVISKSVYVQKRFAAAQKSILDQIAAIDSMMSNPVLNNVDCKALGPFLGVESRCHAQEKTCKPKPADFKQLAQGTVEAEKDLKRLNDQLSELKQVQAIQNQQVQLNAKAQNALETSKANINDQIQSLEAVINVINHRYPWLDGEVFKQKRKEYAGQKSLMGTNSELDAVMFAIGPQLQEDRKTLLAQIHKNSNSATCLLEDSKNCELSKIQNTLQETPPLDFSAGNLSEADKSLKFQQCLFDQKISDDSTKEIGKAVGLFGATALLTMTVPETGGEAVTARSAFAAFKDAMAITGGTRATVSLALNASTLPDSLRSVYQSCIQDEKQIQLEQATQNANYCPAYSDGYSSTVRKYEGCLANSVLAAVSVGGTIWSVKSLLPGRPRAATVAPIPPGSKTKDLAIGETLNKKYGLDKFSVMRFKTTFGKEEVGKDYYMRAISSGNVIANGPHDMDIHAEGYVMLSKKPVWQDIRRFTNRCYEVIDKTKDPELRQKLRALVFKLGDELEDVTAELTAKTIGFSRYNSLIPNLEDELRDLAGQFEKLTRQKVKADLFPDAKAPLQPVTLKVANSKVVQLTAYKQEVANRSIDPTKEPRLEKHLDGVNSKWATPTELNQKFGLSQNTEMQFAKVEAGQQLNTDARMRSLADGKMPIASDSDYMFDVIGYARLAKTPLMQQTKNALQKLFKVIDNPSASAETKREATALIKTIDTKISRGVKDISVDDGNLTETQQTIESLQRSLESNIQRASSL